MAKEKTCVELKQEEITEKIIAEIKKQLLEQSISDTAVFSDKSGNFDKKYIPAKTANKEDKQ